MPIVEDSGINWAREVDEKETEIEYNEESGFKKVVEYKTEDEKKFKVTNIFRVEKVKVPKTVAKRKEWPKFGDASNDPPGVNSATTVVSDECFMQFLTNKEETTAAPEASSAPIPLIKCRFCKGDHWSAKCPHKDLLQDKMSFDVASSKDSSSLASGGPGGSKTAYVPPSMRAGASAGGSAASRPGSKFSDFGKGPGNKDDWTVRVSNLPEEATENDLMELFKPFGKVNRVFLAKDKNKQISRGFAFVTFMIKEDAQRAIWGVNDYGYNHLILKVEWAKPSKDAGAV
jgi:translation initiation factor 3 subunit G